MLYFLLLFHYILQILKQFFQSNNHYHQKSKKDKVNSKSFIPYTSHNKKPSWVKDEVIYLKIHLANHGCRKLAIAFNKKHAHKKITVSKSYVYNIIKANNYEIIKQRKELKNRVPKPIPKNLIWSIDLSTIKEQQIFGVIDNGSRALISLQYVKDKSTINIIRVILKSIELYGKPKIIKSDNEYVFTSKLMRTMLYLLGIKRQTTDIASPWQNGKIERLFLTMKLSFQDITFPTSQSLEIGLKEFRFFYNHIRPHQHLNYSTPNEVWDSKPMATSQTHEPYYFTALCGNVAGFYYRE
jgi:hypothetical protein